MLVYISICSLIGSLSVVFTQGIGGAIVHSFTVENQFTNWFVYLVLILTLVTLAIEIIYLNKALNIFNTAVVTPTYYVLFTTLTIVSSIVFYRGFDASATKLHASPTTTVESDVNAKRHGKISEIYLLRIIPDHHMGDLR